MTAASRFGAPGAQDTASLPSDVSIDNEPSKQGLPKTAYRRTALLTAWAAAATGSVYSGAFAANGIQPCIGERTRPDSSVSVARLADDLLRRGSGRAHMAQGLKADLGSKFMHQEVDVDAQTAWRKLEQMRQRIAVMPDLPRWWGKAAVDYDGLLWWFLQDRHLDVLEAKEKLETCLRWRKSFRSERLGPEFFIKEMKKGYVHKYPDVVGRPVILAFARHHNVLDRRIEESTRMCTWLLETALKRLAMPEPPAKTSVEEEEEAAGDAKPAETALGIFDLREFSILQADMEVASFLIEALYKYYPGRVGRVLLVGAPDVFKSFWESVRPLLGRYASLADFVTVQEVREKYFKPGEAPIEFQEGSARALRGATARRASIGGPRVWDVFSMSSLSVGVMVGSSVLAASFAGRRKMPLHSATRGSGSVQPMRASRVSCTALPGLGSCQVLEEPVDAEVACHRLQALRQRLERHVDLPRFRGRRVLQDDALLWWFLRDRQLDVDQALEKLLECLSWRQSFRVEKLGPELFTREVRARKAYVHKHRDLAGRPVLVVKAERHNLMDRDLQQSCQMCVWTLERLLDRLATVEPPQSEASLPHGEQHNTHAASTRRQSEGPQVEQALGVLDLSEFSPLQADVEFASFALVVLHKYYPMRLARILMVDAPEVFEGFFEGIRPFLHRYADRIDFVSADYAKTHYFAPGEAPPELAN
eukprot:TRINITY_DN111538_c0_g1_i1.p1 TRINITY_DN111538_c0_g1~~TRINITY_DN111538_c0_g1_i1.p1  ORF type:complete len:721 (-),score=86.84 TRINITY_DN111538_c0_g1_i1:262-2376(-)